MCFFSNKRHIWFLWIPGCFSRETGNAKSLDSRNGKSREKNPSLLQSNACRFNVQFSCTDLMCIFDVKAEIYIFKKTPNLHIENECRSACSSASRLKVRSLNPMLETHPKNCLSVSFFTRHIFVFILVKCVFELCRLPFGLGTWLGQEARGKQT
jgi:hypothetical protein